MKKSFMYLMAMMMVAMLSVGFASCGSDDDEEGGGGGFSSKMLVGDWKIVGGDAWAMSDIGKVYSFYEDGTCSWGDGGPYSGWNLANGKLYMTRGDGRVEEYSYEFKEGQLHLTYDNEYTILEKIDLSSLNIDSSYFVGSWEASGGSAYGKWSFSSNGVCSFVDRGSASGTWEYNPESRMLVTTCNNWKWEIVSATEDEWTARNGQSWKRVK